MSSRERKIILNEKLRFIDGRCSVSLRMDLRILWRLAAFFSSFVDCGNVFVENDMRHTRTVGRERINLVRWEKSRQLARPSRFSIEVDRNEFSPMFLGRIVFYFSSGVMAQWSKQWRKGAHSHGTAGKERPGHFSIRSILRTCCSYFDFSLFGSALRAVFDGKRWMEPVDWNEIKRTRSA